MVRGMSKAILFLGAVAAAALQTAFHLPLAASVIFGVGVFTGMVYELAKGRGG